MLGNALTEKLFGQWRKCLKTSPLKDFTHWSFGDEGTCETCGLLLHDQFSGDLQILGNGI